MNFLLEVSYLKKSNMNFLLLFLRTKGFQTHLRICANANMFVFERTHENRLFALFAWFSRAALLAGIVKTATGKACNECKTLGQFGLDGLCLNARTQIQFSKQQFS